MTKLDNRAVNNCTALIRRVRRATRQLAAGSVEMATQLHPVLANVDVIHADLLEMKLREAKRQTRRAKRTLKPKP